jgi:Fe-S-cluster containining protein
VQDPLPLHLTPLVRAWQCRKRGMCCRVHRIPVSETERRRITRNLAAAHDDRAALMQEGALEVIDGWQQLPRRDDACVFLAKNLCSLHTRFGPSAIPGACRKFPHLLLMTDDRLIASLSFQCPTALELLAHAPRFETLIEPDGEPPTDSVSYLAEPSQAYVDLEGRLVSPAEFWRRHWQLFERLAARPEADPLSRLIAFAEAETDQRAPPPAVLTESVWRADFWHPGATFQLAKAAGESAFDLSAWWEPVTPQAYTF